MAVTLHRTCNVTGWTSSIFGIGQEREKSSLVFADVSKTSDAGGEFSILLEEEPAVILMESLEFLWKKNLLIGFK